MTITSPAFLLFFAVLFLSYYLLPKKLQWMVLLAGSLAFYLLSSPRGILYVLITASTIYAATRWMDALLNRQKALLKAQKETLSKQERTDYKAAVKSKRKAIMVCTILLNIGILCVFKYANFALEQVNSIAGFLGAEKTDFHSSLIVPLGISFYTFQSIGYLVDVYWENCGAEKNYFKNLLFVSFFPQMTQGPISDHEELSSQLFRPHDFTYRAFSRGFQRMVWGFLKKMVLANILSPYVQDVFANYSQYTGITTLIGAFLYSIQIYADFSGYMDIMCGACEMLGIRLTENFDRPYFSKSVAEYWRRWHISLGVWFKKYIYYPIAVAKWNRKLGSSVQKRLGKHFGQTVPATIALVVVWLTTGLWHGASWAYIAWGGVNGLFIIFSLWMEPVYEACKSALHIREDKWFWRAFQTLRTFLLVTFIKVLPEVGSLSDGVGLIGRIFTEHSIPTSVSQLFPYVTDKVEFLCVIVCTGAVFLGSLLQRKRPIRDYFGAVPAVVRIGILAAIYVFIILYGVPATQSAGGFLYANF